MLTVCLLLGGVLLCLLLYALWDCRRLRVVKKEIFVPGLPEVLEGFTILQVSDLHDCAYGKDGRGLMEIMDTLQWDLLAVTGDLFDWHHPKRHKNALAFARYACKKSNVWFVEGNHEGKLSEYKMTYGRALAQAGVHILRNDSVSMETHGYKWNLVGVQDRASQEALEMALAGEGFKLLLAHRPENIDRYARAGANLVLSGHAHGGQWRLFGRGLYAPEQGVLPRYFEGVYRHGDTVLYVSAGAGSHNRIPRLFNPPRVDLLTLRREYQHKADLRTERQADSGAGREIP